MDESCGIILSHGQDKEKSSCLQEVGDSLPTVEEEEAR